MSETLKRGRAVLFEGKKFDPDKVDLSKYKAAVVDAISRNAVTVIADTLAKKMKLMANVKKDLESALDVDVKGDIEATVSKGFDAWEDQIETALLECLDGNGLLSGEL